MRKVSREDVLRLEVEETYPKEYEETVKRAREEEQNDILPELSTEIPDLDQYETIYIGYPVRLMTVPSPIKSFLQEVNIENKNIALFVTHAGFGLGDSSEVIREMIPNNTFVDSFSVDDENVEKSEDAIKKWVSDDSLLS